MYLWALLQKRIDIGPLTIAKPFLSDKFPHGKMIKINIFDNKRKTKRYIVDFFWEVVQNVLIKTAVENYWDRTLENG